MVRKPDRLSRSTNSPLNAHRGFFLRFEAVQFNRSYQAGALPPLTLLSLVRAGLIRTCLFMLYTYIVQYTYHRH